MVFIAVAYNPLPPLALVFLLSAGNRKTPTGRARPELL